MVPRIVLLYRFDCTNNYLQWHSRINKIQKFCYVWFRSRNQNPLKHEMVLFAEIVNGLKYFRINTIFESVNRKFQLLKLFKRVVEKFFINLLIRLIFSRFFAFRGNLGNVTFLPSTNWKNASFLTYLLTSTYSFQRKENKEVVTFYQIVSGKLPNIE